MKRQLSSHEAVRLHLVRWLNAYPVEIGVDALLTKCERLGIPRVDAMAILDDLAACGEVRFVNAIYDGRPWLAVITERSATAEVEQ